MIFEKYDLKKAEKSWKKLKKAEKSWKTRKTIKTGKLKMREIRIRKNWSFFLDSLHILTSLAFLAIKSFSYFQKSVTPLFFSLELLASWDRFNI